MKNHEKSYSTTYSYNYVTEVSVMAYRTQNGEYLSHLQVKASLMNTDSSKQRDQLKAK